jgi:aspartyl/asparaginyl beta-hydroxylase (cupin superfamily)
MSAFSSTVEGLAEKAVVWTRPFAERVVVKTAKHGNPPVYDTRLFPEFRILEDNWRVIRRELEAVLGERKRLPSLQDISPQNKGLTNDELWRIFMLYSYGEKLEGNCAKCPETTRLVEQLPGLKTAMFSILSPGKHIDAHRGPYNGVLRYHLGLIIPEPREKCRIRVDRQICTWEEGKGLVFDDSFEHEVWNDTDGMRVVLFITFDRPIRFPFSIFNWGINKLHELSTYHQEPLRRLKEMR